MLCCGVCQHPLSEALIQLSHLKDAMHLHLNEIVKQCELEGTERLPAPNTGAKQGSSEGPHCSPAYGYLRQNY